MEQFGKCLWFFGLSLVCFSSHSETLLQLSSQSHSGSLYIDVEIAGAGSYEYLVDTGATYTTINERVLSPLLADKRAVFIKMFRARLVDGTRVRLPLYSIPAINIAGRCVIRDLEVVVLPADTRGVLGLNALSRVAPLTLSLDPPTLSVSNCGYATGQAMW